YGMTETSPVSTMTTVDDPLEKRVSTVGRAFPHVECKIVDPSTGSPRGTAFPVEGSTILHSTCGNARPTVDTRFSSGSSTVVMVDTGDVSVIPYPITKSRRPSRAWTCFI